MFNSKVKETVAYYERLISEIKENAAARETYLKQQILDLQRMVFSPTSASVISTEAREADAIITVTERPLESTNAQADEDALREYDAILSGEHEEYII